MAFVNITSDGVSFESQEWDEELLIQAMNALPKRRGGFDWKDVTCGVHPNPDFGCFELASRYWRASVCIYLFGTSGYFWEAGAGWVEPWLFTARHSFELYLKGCILYCVWYDELHEEYLSRGDKKKVERLKDQFRTFHSLYELYCDYEKRAHELDAKWDETIVGQAPTLEKMLLTDESKEVLREIDLADDRSFRFRYPSLGDKAIHELQECGWGRDPDQLLKLSGLPKNAGHAIDPIQVINSLHRLRTELSRISAYHGASWDMVTEGQDVVFDLMSEFYGES